MKHPFVESLENIETRLQELTKAITRNQKKFLNKEILDNDEFQELFNISSGTAANWREQGIIAYCQVKSKIYYKVKDINKLINDNYKPLKKK
ncbi:MAG: helix-turn-helix domain-containing protein [Maribacter arcticus]|uniref:helix-turn-helix domain-containing protein n=1 Tax=Maribacter arcticus TaxID=561365 RepID=UPI00300251AF